MDIERRDNDKLVEELRKEADDTEAKVPFFIILMSCPRYLSESYESCRWQNTSRKVRPNLTSSSPSIGSFGMRQVRFPCRAVHLSRHPSAEVYMETLANKLNLSVVED